MIPLLSNELWFSWCEARRHAAQSLLAKGVVTFMLLLLYHVLVGADATSASRDKLLIGFLTWGIAGAAYNACSHHVVDESHAGTLEQLHLSPHGFRAVLMTRGVVQLVVGSSQAMVLAAMAMALTRWVSVPVVPAGALLVLGTPALFGVGLGVGGAAMVDARSRTVGALLHLVLLAVVSVPAHPFNAFALLPFSYAASLLRALVEGDPPAATAYALVAANSASYLVFGMLVFRWFEWRAKRGGLLTGG
ncbi:MAG: hypothetical protein ABMA64_09970 [Myxococcota bacterium]